MGRMLGSHLTGVGTSVLTGTGSTLTATGVCAPAPGLFLTDGASFLTGKKSLLTATEAPSCGGGVPCLPPPVELGAFTITDPSADATIFADVLYDFSCLPNANINFAGTVTSRYVSGDLHDFPLYGIFIFDVVPPAADLFFLFLPVVQMLAAHPVDTAFHTYNASAVIANPAGIKHVVFAMIPQSVTTSTPLPSNQEYINFTFALTGL